jgi:hypothetical protein
MQIQIWIALDRIERLSGNRPVHHRNIRESPVSIFLNGESSAQQPLKRYFVDFPAVPIQGHGVAQECLCSMERFLVSVNMKYLGTNTQRVTAFGAKKWL